MQLDQTANGKIVSVKPNDEFDLSLPETRTAGYRWSLKSNPEACKLLEETTEPNAKPGGEGRHHWRFRAAVLGECEIELHYARPWENASEPAKTFRMRVQIQP